MEEEKGSKLGNILIVLLVLTLIGESGYFFYNRYISNKSNLPFENLNTNQTMDYSKQAQSNPDTQPVSVGGERVSHVGGFSRDKAERILDETAKIPAGFVYRETVGVSIQGKVVAVNTTLFELEGLNYQLSLRLVNSRGEIQKLGFSETEVNKMNVVRVKAGVVGDTASYKDIKPGDNLNIHVTSDLSDFRTATDDVTIEIRTE